MTIAYAPEFFDTSILAMAKKIILTPSKEKTSEERWGTEANHILDLIADQVQLSRGSTVLDYGCGVGRLSRALIDRYDCSVIGVDISQKMCALAVEYVGRDRFVAMTPTMLPVLGFGWADLALSVWVLQHCAAPALDLMKITKALKPRAGMFVVNDAERLVPARNGDGYCWISDHADVRDMLRKSRPNYVEGTLDSELVGEEISRRSFWGHYRWEQMS